MPSVTNKGISKIAPELTCGAGVVTTRNHIHWFVTENGAVNLYGKSLQERARLIISIADPSAPGIPGPGSIRALRTAPPLREKLHGQIITAPRNEKRPFTGRFFAYIRTFVSNRHKAASDRIGK